MKPPGQKGRVAKSSSRHSSEHPPLECTLPVRYPTGAPSPSGGGALLSCASIIGLYSSALMVYSDVHTYRGDDMAHQYIGDLITETLTAEKIEKQFPYGVHHEGGTSLYALGLKEERKVRSWAAEQTAQQSPAASDPTAPSGPRATPRQIGFLLSLIEDDRHHDSHVAIPTDPAVIENLSRKSASFYIDAILSS